jgi:predicted nucleotidyltransferase
MPSKSSPLPEGLSAHPEAKALQAFVERLMQERGDEVEFVVVFGSAAKGNWTQGSDVDVFVGLRVDDSLRLTDRIGLFARWVTGNLEVFPYARSQWERMFAQKHLLLLEALADGIVLVDRGAFRAMRAKFQEWLAKGHLRRLKSGWQILGDDEAR